MQRRASGGLGCDMARSSVPLIPVQSRTFPVSGTMVQCSFLRVGSDLPDVNLHYARAGQIGSRYRDSLYYSFYNWGEW